MGKFKIVKIFQRNGKDYASVFNQAPSADDTILADYVPVEELKKYEINNIPVTDQEGEK